MIEIRKTISFGKIALNDPDKKIYPVEVEIELNQDENETAHLSICGTIWNKNKNEMIGGGQCLDEIAEHLKGNDLFDEIHTYWKHFHLNTMNSGTFRQEQALTSETNRRNELHKLRGEEMEKDLNYADRYDDAVNFLKSIGLYRVKLGAGEKIYPKTKNMRGGYAYGTGWITREIPETVVNRIVEICK